MRGATLFSGGRGVEMLLRDEIDFVYSVEYDPAIAAVGAQLGGHSIVADVRAVDYAAWGALDYLHASPVCKNFSAAKTNGTESDDDMSTAAAVVRCLDATQPRVFTLENVQQYEGSASYRAIVTWLNHNGYMWHAETLNAANYGVPQTRRRLILRAVRDALLPGLPPPVKWVGWYAAIEDLIPTLPESAFAPWQLARLPESIGNFAFGNNAQEWGDSVVFEREPFHAVTGQTGGRSRAFIIGSQNAGQEYSDGIRYEEMPAMTMTARQQPRAWLVGEDSKMGMVGDEAPAMTTRSSSRAANTRAFLADLGNTSREPTILDEAKPSMTVQAWHGRRPSHMPVSWLSAGRVVKMTPRALARFQSFPDWYVLPDKNSLACTVIGNAVPPLLMQQIVRPLL